MSAATETFDWEGAVRGLRDVVVDSVPEPVLVAELERGHAGSAPILFAADDGERYWVKFPGNPQGTQTIVAEAIISEIAPLIGAPVRAARRVRVGESFVGMPYGDAHIRRIPSGLAHGSPLIEDACAPEDVLGHARRDDNARRIPRLLALWDWAMGGDEQWLFDESAEGSIWSFDHGFWLDAAEAEWSREGLATVSQVSWPTPERIPNGLSDAEFYAVADELAAITADLLALAVSRVPREWEPDDGLLGAIGETLFARRTGAARRARTLGTQASRGGRR